MSNWDELVKAGIEAVNGQTSSQWRLGDLALKVEPMGAPITSGGNRNGVRRRLGEFAEAIGITQAMLVEYRTTSHCWPAKHRRPNVGYTVHRILENAPNRFTLIKKLEAKAAPDRVKTNDARRAVGRVVLKSVTVKPHVRRPPGESEDENVVPLNGRPESFSDAQRVLVDAKNRRTVLTSLTTAQLGKLIEDAWAILGARAAA